MHIELVGRGDLGMSSSFSKQFWPPSMFSQARYRAVTKQMSMSINASFPFQALKQIVDIGILQGLTRASTVQLDEQVTGLHFLSVNDDEVIQEVIDQFA